MQIDKILNGQTLEIALTGRLDTITAPLLDKELKEILPQITDFTLNLAGVEYVSSAGLRVILTAQKMMNDNGSMKVTNIGETVKEIFDMTGFTNILTIE